MAKRQVATKVTMGKGRNQTEASDSGERHRQNPRVGKRTEARDSGHMQKQALIKDSKCDNQSQSESVNAP